MLQFASVGAVRMGRPAAGVSMRVLRREEPVDGAPRPPKLLRVGGRGTHVCSRLFARADMASHGAGGTVLRVYILSLL